ncbi:MAG: alpha-galactosidase, partial [Lentisphaerota bacterium]
KRIIVDDGWQYCYGEWEANHLFPNGMEYLAKEIKKMGFVPGLWFAPTIVEPHARIAQMDYDMLAMGESGKPCLSFQCMKRHGFVLDPTVPKVRKHLFDMFKRYADMGYGYFKLDFLGSTLGARKFADASVPRSQIVRKIVEPVYEAVNGKARILGCNYNFEAGNKVVDAVRIGSDIHATWKGICHNVTSVAARFWSNKRLWINDPDFALCRSLDTASDPDMTRLLCCLVYITPEMTDSGYCEFPLVDEVSRPQAELLLSIVLAAAGAVNLSDNMPRLNERGLELARRVVGADSGDAAIPVDLFCSDKPSYWFQKVKDYHRVLLINWNDEPGAYSFDLNPYGVKADSAVNFWNDQIVKINDGIISVELQPRSCLLAVVK